MTATVAEVWAALNPPASTDEKVERNRHGHYMLPDPVTGEIKAWPRVTSFADTLADRRGLETWSKRNIVRGIGARNDLYHLATAAGADDKKMLDDVIAQAEAVARANAGSNSGTALHRLTERVDRGEDARIPNPDLQADVAAYRLAMDAAGIRVARDQGTGEAWIERVLIVPELGLAGMCDRLCICDDTDAWPLPFFGDLKTGKDALRAMDSIPLQLAIYAHASHWYDVDAGQYHEMPQVDQGHALVMHLPLGSAHCELLRVDIKSGWEAVQLALDIRAWRSRKDLAQIITSPVPPATAVDGPGEAGGGATQGEPTPPASPAPAATLLAQRTEWLRDRVKAVIDAGHEAELAGVWPAGCPTLRQGGLTDAQVTDVAAVCDTIEGLHGLPFGPADPAYGRGPVHISEPLAQAVEQMAAASPPPIAESQELADAGRALLDQFDREDERRAVAACALADGLMAAEKLDRLTAVAIQVADPIGAVWFHYGATTVDVRPSDSAINAMVAGATGGDPKYATTGRNFALKRAKDLARALDLPLPRSLAQAAENPLLAALVAAGRGAPEEPTTSSDER